MNNETDTGNTDIEGWGAWADAATQLPATNELFATGEEEEEPDAEGDEPPAEQPVKPEAAATATPEPSAIEQRLAELEAQAKQTAQPPQPAQPEPPKPLIDPATLEVLKADFPELYAAFVVQGEAVEKLGQTVEQLTQREIHRQAEEQRLVQATVQVEIDRIPVLAHYQTKSPELFKQGVELDNVLRQSQPNLTMGQRFEKVAAALVAMHGVPDGVDIEQSNATPEPKTKPKPTAKQQLFTIGDIPGGEPAADTSAKALEEASATDLIGAWWGKSEAELEQAWRQLQSRH